MGVNVNVFFRPATGDGQIFISHLSVIRYGPAAEGILGIDVAVCIFGVNYCFIRIGRIYIDRLTFYVICFICWQRQLWIQFGTFSIIYCSAWLIFPTIGYAVGVNVNVFFRPATGDGHITIAHDLSTEFIPAGEGVSSINITKFVFRIYFS